MSFFNRYLLTKSSTQLIIIRSRNRQILNSVVYIGVIAIWYMALFIQNPKKENLLIYLFYIAPLLMLPVVFRSIKNSVRPDIFKFDKHLGELLINDIRQAKLSDITKVIVDYPNKQDIEECTLELEVSGQSNLKIDRSDAGFNNEVIRTAESIAEFLDVKAIDRHPHNRKI